jgi:hypothetical protein
MYSHLCSRWQSGYCRLTSQTQRPRTSHLDAMEHPVNPSQKGFLAPWRIVYILLAHITLACWNRPCGTSILLMEGWSIGILKRAPASARPAHSPISRSKVADHTEYPDQRNARHEGILLDQEIVASNKDSCFHHSYFQSVQWHK